jgi:hypothetical protein
VSAYRVRVCDVTSTVWRATSRTLPVDPGDLAAQFVNFYKPFETQLPTVLAQRVFAQGQVAAGPGSAAHGGEDLDLNDVRRAEVVLFGLPVPVGQIVATVLLEFDTAEVTYSPDSRICNVPGACVDDRLLLDGRPVVDIVSDLALQAQADNLEDGAVDPERHTLVLVQNDSAPIPDEPVIASLLYGRHVALRPEFHSLRRPASLNRAEGEYAAVSRHASFLYGQPAEVENSVLLTTVQAVGTSTRFRQIWYDAQQNVLAFQSRELPSTAIQIPDDLEMLADMLGNLEFDLAVNVEAASEVGLGSSTSQIEDFHRDLYEIMRVPERSRTAGQMFARLRSGLEAELMAIDSRDRANAALSIETIASLLSVVGFPIFFVLAYFGVNAREIDQHASMFSVRYWPVYACAALLSVCAILLILRGRRTRRQRR